MAWAAGLDVDAVLISHNHFDYIGGVSALPDGERGELCPRAAGAGLQASRSPPARQGTRLATYGCISASMAVGTTAARPAANHCSSLSTSRRQRVSLC
ncbi:MBL fold metallo-hydrolase [Billgrantia diversa]|uniref:MBL fold metallo-hydrolase n=1 Tax=Halomonas sp. MCCC 1A13316 TaxID=2733487 RepID=UPI001E63D112|nr:MBL fold metallo-hydrolase [Halomonas sp. MCCC 1A13316]